METIVQLLPVISAIIPVWFIIDLKRDVVKIRDNHLKHIADDITDIKVRLAILEDHDK